MTTAREMRLAFTRSQLQERLPAFLRSQRWFGGKARPMRVAEIVDAVPFDPESLQCYFFLVRVAYDDGAHELYSVPLIAVYDAAQVPLASSGERAAAIESAAPDGRPILLYDAMACPQFLEHLLDAIRAARSLRGETGVLRATRTSAFQELAPPNDSALRPRRLRAEQSNSSAVFGDRLVLKLYRRIEEGINPDLEIGAFLTEKSGFRHLPLLAGSLAYVRDGGVPASMAMLQAFVANQGDAWEFTLRAVGEYYGRVPSQGSAAAHVSTLPVIELAPHAAPAEMERLLGDYLPSARLLGRRTAELHLALAASSGDPAFDAEPYSLRDQEEFRDRALALLHNSFRLLRQHADSLPPEVQAEARRVLDREAVLENQFASFSERPLHALRTRIHGDYHLGQVLVSGSDFMIIDFEGEPARSLAERRGKRSPLQDVAGMLRSFHYAAYAPLLGAAGANLDIRAFGAWAKLWQRWISATFLQAYLATAAAGQFLPQDRRELRAILDAHLLEKAVYELGYELNNRPTWVRIPLDGIAQLLDSAGTN